jgi:hypothetical protein
VYAVFDPCAAHSDGATKKAVRELIAASGHVYAELPSGGGSGCCGFGGLPYPANPELAAKLGALRTSASELPYVTYCVNCRDVFRRNGKECRHVLELALPDESGQHAELGNAVTAPSLSERRAGRERLRRLLLSELWKENTPMDMVNDGLPEIEYAEGLRAKMDTLLLLDSDVAAVIERAERESAQLVNQETGHYTAHGRVGEITCWVTYRRDGEGFFVENVYCHRMRISGE